MTKRPTCFTCGGDLTDGQIGRQKQHEADYRRACDENDSTYAHLRAVIENCKTMDAAAIRHQLVGLLPEVRDMEPERKAQMRAKGMGHLVDLHEQRIRENWAEFGYGIDGGTAHG